MQPKKLSFGKERAHAGTDASVPNAAPVGLCRAVPRRDEPGAGMLYGAGGARGVRPSRALSVVGGVAGLSHAGVDSGARPAPLPTVRQEGRDSRPRHGGKKGGAVKGQSRPAEATERRSRTRGASVVSNNS